MTATYVNEAGRLRKDRRAVLIGPGNRFTSKHRDLFVRAATLDEAEAHVHRVLAVCGLEVGARS